jgi:iron complex outermembrane receptor protein
MFYKLESIEDLTLDGTIRSENYSDFGNAFVWKVSGAYTINDKYTLRVRYLQGLEHLHCTKFILKSTIQFCSWTRNSSRWFGKQRIFSSRFIRYPKLKETSTNFTFGIGGKVSRNFSFTLDYYSINLKTELF